jgi:pilus assembly protein CpaE
MSIAMRVCLFDTNAGNDPSFRPPFEKLEDITVVDLCPNWNLLQEHLRFGNIDVAAVNLDSADDNARFFAVQRIAEVAPDCAIIGVSRDVNPDTIIGAMRAGCSQFVRWPIELTDLRTALERIRQMRLPAASGTQQIAVIGSSGGAGSTTLACNLALELGRVTGRRVGLVDMDLQFGDVACAFDLVPKHSVADVCREGIIIDRTLLEMALDELPCKVSVLARPENLEDAEEVSPGAVEQLFRWLAQMYPFTVVDLPRHFSLATLAAIRSADRILIVSQLGVPFLRNASRIYECLLQAGIGEGVMEFVLNRCNANYERIKPQEVEKHFRRPVFATIPNDYKRITASRDMGHPILTTAPNSPARLAIHELARKLASDHLDKATEQQGKGGFFRMFRRKRSKPKEPVA